MDIAKIPAGQNLPDDINVIIEIQQGGYVLGGVTEFMLHKADLPVLMAR